MAVAKIDEPILSDNDFSHDTMFVRFPNTVCAVRNMH